jgi:mannose-6-phosphate isomerase-like protein (cupin superfamily)
MTAAARPFVYAKPETDRTKAVVRLARTDRMVAAVQVLKRGGENNLHSHAHLDGFWFVLRGQATFYGPDDVVLARLGVHEGILVPRNAPYWFESSGDEDLELLQVEAFDIPIPISDKQLGISDRTDFAPRRESFGAPITDASVAEK